MTEFWVAWVRNHWWRQISESLCLEPTRLQMIYLQVMEMAASDSDSEFDCEMTESFFDMEVEPGAEIEEILQKQKQQWIHMKTSPSPVKKYYGSNNIIKKCVKPPLPRRNSQKEGME